MSKTQQCKTCGAEIAKSAKSCPNCGGKVKKPFYTRVWFIVLVVLVVIGAVAGSGGSKENEKPVADSTNVTQPNDKTETTPEPTPEIVYTAYDVSELMNDLDGNALKASEKYEDQYVELNGKLSVIDSSGKYISITDASNPYAITGVQCFIKSEAQKTAIMEMSTGDMITVKGKITSVGEVLGYSLDIDEIV